MMYNWMERLSDDAEVGVVFIDGHIKMGYSFVTFVMMQVPTPRRIPPCLSVAFEYVEAEQEFNFYIRNVSFYEDR